MPLDKLKDALKKTRDVLNMRVEDVFVPGRTLETCDLEILEEALIAADVGIEVTEEIIEAMKSAARAQKMPPGGPLEMLESELLCMLEGAENLEPW